MASVPERLSRPCWLQVGPTTESVHAAWIRPIEMADNRLRVAAQGDTVDEVTDTAIIFEHGLVVLLGEEPPELDPSCDTELRSLVGGYARAQLDVETGEVLEATCKPLPRD